MNENDIADDGGPDKPKVWIHPPTAFIAALVIGYVVRVFIGGVIVIPRVIAEGIGGLIIIVSLALVVASIRAFGESGEELNPATPSETLFIDGPYKLSRNPIYLAMVMFCIGFGVATSNLWILVAALFLGVLLNYLVIAREEAYLARRFGAAFEDYRRRVRRWI